ncbi:unnamed protein product [Trichobilharzia szidati]|nr:unnamed protein product [Trichobilharzia szidati]
MSHHIKVQARNHEICSFSPPCRDEVRSNNYQRRCYQKQSEGLYAPINKPYRELGYPLIIEAPKLVTEILGYIPQRPNVLYGYEADESSRGVENQNEELLKDNLNTYVLTSESAEKSCQPLRPKHVRVNEKSNVYPAVQSVSAYMKRRRKRGLIDFKKVIQQSNNITNCVKNGRSFFGLLNQEIIQKVHNFWELHNRIIESRKNRIAPPIRMYTPNTTTTTTATTAIAITTEQNASNNETNEKSTDEIDEDILLDEEPEIRKLMSDLIAAGCNLSDLLGNLSQQSTESIEKNTDYSTLTIERRRHRQLRQWFTTEAERPFTPKYFNICRPNFINELKRLDDLANSNTYKLLNVKNDRQTGNGVKNEGTDENASDGNDGDDDKELYFDSLCELIYMQLCCVLWLMEQMYASGNSEETDPNWRPISASWKFNPNNNASTEAKTSSDQPSHPDQIWFNFIYDTNSNSSTSKQMKMKPRFRNISSAHSLTSIQSGTQSSDQKCTTPLSAFIKSQSMKRMSRSVAESIDELSEVESTPLSKSEERLNFLSRMNSQEGINPSTSRSSIYNQKLLGLFSTADDTSTTTNRRCVQFMKKSNMPKQSENQWVSFRNQIQKMSRETLKEIAHQIEVDMDKETLKEAESRLTGRGVVASKTIKKRPFTTGNLKEIPKEFTSHKLTNLIDSLRSQLSIMTDEKSIELEDRLEFMKRIRPEICLTKYQNIPINGHTHVAMKRMHQLARYDKAASELARKTAEKKELAPWYVDLLIDLAELLNEHKIKYVLSKLKIYAQLSPSQFTVLSFTRVLQSLTLWEILLPATTVAIDFIRMRVLDMSIEEYLDWLCEAHPKVKSYILHENETES